MKRAGILVVIPGSFSPGVITGKIFEYLQAQRPILAIAPTNGDLAQIVNKTQSGEVVDFDDKTKLKQVVLEMYKKYKQKSLEISSKNIDQYHRKNLTKQLAEIIHHLK